jgi:regulator of protease activity HflC (stomatin/prohibitin superfamily)
MLRNRLNDKTRRWGVQITDVAFSGVEFPDNVKDSLSAAGRLQREAYLREIEAASFKETAQTLGLTPVEMLNWRYAETLREIAKNPNARIVVSPDPFSEGGDSSSMATGFIGDDDHASP